MNDSCCLFPQMSGMFESWMHKLVAAVMRRETEANVVIVDWIAMAQQLYPDAVNHTQNVGLDIAAMINWLQVKKTKKNKLRTCVSVIQSCKCTFKFLFPAVELNRNTPRACIATQP